jgi:hypothetical protein
LLKKRPGAGCSASSIGGRNSVRMKYQMKSCSRSGTLRNTSTYTVQSERRRKLRESRPMPTSVPVIVASTMPSRATRSVFDRPVRYAFAYESAESNSHRLSLMAKPAGWFRKSKPLWIPRTRMLRSVLWTRYQPAATTIRIARIW